MQRVRATHERPRFEPNLLERLSQSIDVPHDQRERLSVQAPWSGETIGHLPCCTREDVAHLTARVRAAQAKWARRPFRERAAIMLRLHDMLLTRQAELLDLVQLETGKARLHAVEEVMDTAMVARYYAYNGERMLRPRRRKSTFPILTSGWEHHHPRGVVGVIAPWNYPLVIAITDSVPALLAGNGVLVKPDQQTSFTALWCAQLLYEAGLPRDLLQIVTGEGPVVGPLLVDAVDYVSFTGSTATGRVVARQAAERLIGCSLELGGKNASIVMDDADLARAVEGVMREGTVNAGQLCVSTERLYVHSRIYDRFVARLAQKMGRMRLAPGFRFGVDMGSLISARQLAAVERHVEDARDKGARVLAGGKARPDLGPYFYEPTLLEGVTEAMTVCAEETFGPVLSLYRFDEVEDVLGRINASRYGLNANIWTRNVARGKAIATRIQAGTVNINECYRAAWSITDAPMGGFKESGGGRRHGVEGLLKFTQSQTVALQRLLPLAPSWGIPEAPFTRIVTLWLRLLRHLPGLR